VFASQLTSWLTLVDALVAMGVPLEDAKIIADVLLTSDLWGVRSHGVAHLKMYYERMKAGLQLPATQLTVVRDTPTTAVMDGGNGMGRVVGHHAMKLAIKKPGSTDWARSPSAIPATMALPDTIPCWRSRKAWWV